MKIILSHKIAVFTAAVVLVAAGYFGYQKIFSASGETRYVLAKAEKKTLIVSISGSGQVSASNQLELKPKASGDIVYVGAVDGQAVRAGTLIAEIDSRDAQKAVRDAEANLESAKLALAKLEGLGGGNTPRVKLQAEYNLRKAYEDGFGDVSNAFLDLPSIMTGLQNILFGFDYDKSSWNIDYYANTIKDYDIRIMSFRDAAKSSYDKARSAYDKNFDDYKTVSRVSEPAVIEQLINETYNTSRYIAEAVKNTNNLIQFYEDRLAERSLTPKSAADTHLSALLGYTGKINTHISALSGVITSIKDNRDAIDNADIDVASQKLTVKQRENALQDAKDKLADYFIRAPFDGIVAVVNVKKGDSASPSLSAATLITTRKIAEISLNEVDAAKIKIKEKANLTFDAIPGLVISGEVASIDTVGTVSQGVVTYNVKIGFDTQDERVKSGMSVSAAIITDAKTDALVVPNSAVKTQGEITYVEVPEGDDASPAGLNINGIVLKNPLGRKTVETGLSNDEFTEILSGINEGDFVVARALQAASRATTQTRSLFPIPGGGGNRGGGLGR